MDRYLTFLNQSLLNPADPKTLFQWVVNLFPIIYVSLWVAFYTYLMVAERAGLDLIAQQIWVYMSIIQMLVKLLNGVLQTDKFKELIGWCESAYTTKFKPEYQVIFNKIFEKTNGTIALFFRWE